MRKTFSNLARKSMAFTLAAIMTLSTASAAFAAEVDESIAPAVEAEAAEAAESGVADESLETAIDTEIAAVDEQASEEAAVIEESVIVPEAEESGEEVTAEEETSGEGFEAGEYSEQIDSGAEVITDESAAEVTEEAEAAESIEVTEEVMEDAKEVAESSEEKTEGETTSEESEAAEAEESITIAVEELLDMEGNPIDESVNAARDLAAAQFVGSAATKNVTVSNNGSYGYAGTGTRSYTFDGAVNHGWCVEPSLVGDAGTVVKTATEITDSSFGGYYGKMLRMVAYLMPFAPGYAQNPVKGQLDGLSDGDKYIAGHLIMAYAFEIYATNTGINKASWSGGMNPNEGSYRKYIQLGELITTLWPYAQGKSAPAGFHLWMIPGTSTSQTYMFWTYEPVGYLRIHKKVTFGDGYLKNRLDGAPGREVIASTPRYYMAAGIKFGVFSDEACTRRVGVLELGSLNVADSKEYLEVYSNVLAVAPGTYYVKEISVPVHEVDYPMGVSPVVHRVVVTEGNTADASVTVTADNEAIPFFIQINKVSADPSYAVPLEGAEFLIYTGHNSDGTPSGILGKIKTEKDGKTRFFAIPARHDLYIKEITAPDGYEINEEEIHLVAGQDLKCAWSNRKIVTISEEPSTSGSLQVIKQPEESAKDIVTGNDCYSLEGAVFEVYSDEDCTKLVDGGTLTTDAEGKTEVLSGLDIGDYYIIETVPSAGFGLPTKRFTKANPYKVSITAETVESTKPVEAKCYEPPKNDPIAIEINKVDAEGEEIKSLAGAKFAINYYNGTYAEDNLPEKPMWKWVVQTVEDDGEYKAGLNRDGSFIQEESDPLYTVLGQPTLPYGTVTVTELEAPSGYVAEKDKLLGIYVIDEKFHDMGGVTVSADGVATLDTKIKEKRARYGVSFTKVDDAGTKLANVPFLVKNKKTGEQHIMLTDANGVLSTEANKHSANTNANDKAYAGGVIDESKLDASAGVWFSGAKETDLTYLDDARGALPYGDYTITELRSSANEGMSLVAPFTVKIDGTKEDGEVIDLGNKVDKNKNIITAVTSDRTGTQIALAENNAAFADSVTLSGYKGESIITTKIYDIAANQQLAFADGKTEIVTTVTANGKETNVNVPFRFDASALAGKAVAVVTTVENAGETATHNADFTDEAEKIYFPLVSTRATVDGGKAAVAGGTKTIVDRVTYAGFPDGMSVKAVAEAVRKGATAAEDVVLATASKEATFKTSGTINTQLSVNTDELGGAGVYINEKIYVTVGGKDILVAQESGRTDNNQNVSFIEISTKVVNAETGSGLAFAKKDTAFTEALTIAGFTGNVTAVTKLYNVTDGAYAAFADGTSEITTTITADGSKQTVDIPFVLDGTAYAGKVLTIETAVTGNGQTFKHNEAHDDKAETIYFPTVTTVAEADNGHYASLADAKEIKDTITWAGMPEGIVLTTKTRVFILGEDASKDKEITEAAVTNTYAVEASDGSHEVIVTLDTNKYAGQTLYITEEDYVTVDGKEVLIASETDREAIDQYIYIPKLITTAVATETKEKKIASVGVISITDTVDYSGFKTGETLKTVTEAWAKGATAEEDILIKSVEGTYTTEKAKGSYDVVLKFTLTDDIAGKPVYVVEKDYIGDVLVATEGDRDNENQTVTPSTIATTLTDTKTETHIAYAGPKVKLQDEIKYKNLIVGRKYKLYGLLQNEEGYAYNTKGEVTGVVAADALWPDKDLTEDDEPMEKDAREAAIEKVISDNDLIYAMTVRKAETKNGSFFVDFEFDGVPFKGKKTVAAEGLYEEESDGKLLAIHSDPKDRDQTEEFPELLTTATDKATGTKMVGAFDGQTVIDKVDYRLMGEGTEIITVTELVKKGESAEEDEVVKTIRSKQTVSGDGSYEVEIPFDAAGFAGDTFYVTERNYIVKKDGTEEPVSDHVDRDDEKQTVYVPKLITSAIDAKDGTKLISALDGENAKVIDTVNYENMVPGTAVITIAKLFVKGETAEDDKLVTEVRAEAARLIETADGSYEVEIPFDASKYEGKTLYVTEENYIIVTTTDDEGNVTEEEVKISEHVDRDDEEQTVKVPEIGTTLTDSETQTHISLADAEVTNNDEVAYKNLIPGETYPVVTVYMDEAGYAVTKDGKYITAGGSKRTPDYYYSLDFEDVVNELDKDKALYAVSEFVADAENGSTVVTVKYNGIPFLGRKVVAAEGVYEDGKILAVHIVPDDEGQTVYLPKIVTKATNAKSGLKHLLAEKAAVIRDAFQWEEMLPGTEALVESRAYVKGETAADDALVAEASKSLTIEDRNGSESVDVAVDLSDKAGATIYITETISVKNENGEYVVVSEETSRDIEDQTVYVPKMGTTLVDSETQTHISYGDASVTNIDTIAYENMPLGDHEIITIYMDETGYALRKDGTTYTDALAETLNRCDDDKLTAAEKLDAVENRLKALNVLYARTIKTLTEKTGSVDVTVSYNGIPFLGKKVVAGETMYDEAGNPIAMHFIAKDEGQTVYIPKVITLAVDGKTGGKALTASLTTTIVDKLKYEGYPEGTEITTVLEVFDTATDKPVIIDGKPVTVEKSFKTDASGKTEVTVVFNGTGLVGKKLGLTEKNYLTVNGKRILVSEDSYKTNNDQIVEIVEDGKIDLSGGRSKQRVERKIVKTGDTSNMIVWIAVMMASVVVLYVMAKRKFPGIRKN